MGNYNIGAGIVRDPLAEPIDSGLSTGVTVAGQGGETSKGGAVQTTTPSQTLGTTSTETSVAPGASASPAQVAARAEDPLTQTTPYGGAQAGFKLSEGTYGFRQNASQPAASTGSGLGGYDPSKPFDYSNYLEASTAGEPIPAPATPTVSSGGGDREDPNAVGGGYAGSYNTSNQGIVTGDFGQGYTGRKSAAQALGYETGRTNLGGLGTAIGFATGIPGLGFAGSHLQSDEGGKIQGDVGTIDSATGGVFGNDGRAYNVHTGEGLASYNSFGSAWDAINPFNEDKISTTDAASNLGVSDASQAGLRTIKGEQSIQDLLDAAGSASAPPDPGLASAVQAQNQFEINRREAAIAQQQAAAEEAARQRAQQRNDTSAQTQQAIQKGNVNRQGQIHNPFEANRAPSRPSPSPYKSASGNTYTGQKAANKRAADEEARAQSGGTRVSAVTDRHGNAVRSSSGRVVTSTPPPRRESSGGGGGGSDDCFVRGTLFKMWDGSLKEIQDITIGDRMAEGGLVTGVIVASAVGTDWYNYGGTIVSGSHIVKHMGQWMYVADTGTKGVSRDDEVLYCLNNENHIMVDAKGNTFTDYNAIDFDDEILDKLRRS